MLAAVFETMLFASVFAKKQPGSIDPLLLYSILCCLSRKIFKNLLFFYFFCGIDKKNKKTYNTYYIDRFYILCTNRFFRWWDKIKTVKGEER